MRKKIFKRKVLVLLASIWTAVFILSTAFVRPVSVAAADVITWYNGDTETSISVEAGSKFYIGDFVRILTNGTSTTASLVSASYNSQNKKAATVNGKGYVKVKKEGTTDLTVRCQKVTLVCHLTVEKKNTFSQSKAVKELRAAVKKLTKGMPKKLTTTKGFALKKKREEYLISYGAYSAKMLSYDGFLYQNQRPATNNGDESRSEKLAVPEAGRYLTADALLRQFMITNDPTSVSSKKTMRIASASVDKKSGRISVKLAGKISAEQILAAQLVFPKRNGSDMGKNKAEIIVPIYDETARKYYRGLMVLKKGGRQFQIDLREYADEIYWKTDVTSGHVYWIGSKSNWGNGTKVTVK